MKKYAVIFGGAQKNIGRCLRVHVTRDTYELLYLDTRLVGIHSQDLL